MAGVRGNIKSFNLGLSKPTSLGGVEKTYMTLNMTFCIIVAFTAFPHWPMLLTIPFFIIFHIIGRAINKRDPFFFEVLKWYRRYSNDSTKYLFAQRSVMSKGFPFIPRSIKIKGIKNINPNV